MPVGDGENVHPFPHSCQFLRFSFFNMMIRLVTVALVALLIGGGSGYYFAASSRDTTPASHDMGTMTMDAMMASMNAELVHKQGDEFDKAFIDEMITHHRGAVEMAELALENANHVEIKQMAEAIISAQTTEIQTMQEWRQLWYGEESVTSGDAVDRGSTTHDLH